MPTGSACPPIQALLGTSSGGLRTRVGGCHVRHRARCPQPLCAGGGIGLDAELRQALNGGVVAACVGPVCAEGAIEEGVLRPLVPSRARLVPMIQALTDHFQEARSS